MPEDPPSFFRRWRVVIPLFGILIVALLWGFHQFVDHSSNSPIVDPYLTVINKMSSGSPRARQRLEQYYAKHQRQTVASKHYPGLCNEMREIAALDGMQAISLPDCPELLGEYEKP